MPNDVINQITIKGTTYDINGGGHVIEDSDGTDMTQRSNLQFLDAGVSDDSTNNRTKIENVRVIDDEDELDDAPDGMYMGSYDDADIVTDASNIGYDNTESGLESNNVQSAIDEVVDTLDDKIDISTKGVTNGVAELDSTGKVPSSQLPSFVDDVIEVADYDHLPATGETGKIYVTLDTNKTYRWGGTEYVEISESLALGETSSTAYRGDRGKAAYDHSQLTSGNPHNVTKSEVGLGNVDNTSDSTKKTNFTGSIASGNTGFVTGGDAYTALSNKVDKVSSATNGNLAGLDGSGNLTDAGWSGDKTTTNATGNPISISGLKSNQLAINPIITFEPTQDLHGQSKPYPAGGGKNLFDIDNVPFGTVSDGVWTFGGTTAQLDITFKANTQYAFSGYETQSGANKNVRLRVVYTDDTTENVFLVTSTTRTAFTYISTANKSISYVRAYWGSDASATVAIEKFQIEEGNQATAYAPYENICPISGYDKIEVLSCGKNILPLTLDNIKKASINSSPTGSWSNNTWSGGGITIEVQYDNYGNVSGLKANGTANQNVLFIFAGGINLKYTQYTFSGCPSGGAAETYRMDARNMATNIMFDTGEGVTFQATTGNNGYVLIRIQSGTSVSNLVFKPQLEESATKTAFEPFNKTTSISESLGQTLYRFAYDVRSGKITTQYVYTTFSGASDETIERVGTNVSGKWRFVLTKTGLVTIPWSDGTHKSGMLTTNILDEITNTDTNACTVGIHYRANGGGNSFIAYFGDNYTTVDDVKALLQTTPLQVVYAIPTTTTIQLTPHEISLLKDYAYVSTNGTSIALDYHNGELASLGDVNQLAETVEKSRFHRYSTDEQVVGSWIDGSIIYEKTIDCGVLPNNTGKWVDHNISRYKMLIDAYGIAFSTTRNETICVPFVHRAVIENQIQLSFTSTQIGIFTGSDRTAYDKTYIVMRYIKS